MFPLKVQATFSFNSLKQCRQGLSAVKPSLNPPIAWLPKLSPIAVMRVPFKVFKPSDVLKVYPYNEKQNNVQHGIVRSVHTASSFFTSCIICFSTLSIPYSSIKETLISANSFTELSFERYLGGMFPKRK